MSLQVLVRYFLAVIALSVIPCTAADGGAEGHLHPGELLPAGMVEPGMPAQGTDVGLGLHIKVIEGEDSVNIVKKKTAVKPVVEVRDRNNLPVAGLLVTFTSPTSGPSVVFANGAHSAVVTTDSSGRATILASKPSAVGKFQVNVSASFQSEVATATISMQNVLSATAATSTAAGGGAAGGGTGLSAGVIGLIAGVAAAAAVGIAVGLTHHGDTSSPTIPTATVGVGIGGSVGAPH